MAAGDFTAADSLIIQAMMEGSFQEGVQANSEFKRPYASAKAITGEQTARIEPIMQGKTCIGWKVFWQKSGVETPTYSGAVSGDTLACDITGAELEADSKTYTADKHIRHNVGVNTGDCENDIKANQRRLKAIRKAINNIRVGFNTATINFLDAQKQVNQDAGVTTINRGNGAWAVNADTKTIELPSADLVDEKALAFVDAVLSNNDIDNYFLLHGRHNWYELAFNAAYTRLNDDQRSIFATLDDRNHYRDIRYLDQTLVSSDNTFAVNPDSLVFINKVVYENTEAQLISPKDGHWVFSLQDPDWVWSNNGVLTPVTYNVLMQKGCAGFDANGQPTYDEAYQVQLLYELANGPEGPNGETGIMKFTTQ